MTEQMDFDSLYATSRSTLVGRTDQSWKKSLNELSVAGAALGADGNTTDARRLLDTAAHHHALSIPSSTTQTPLATSSVKVEESLDALLEKQRDELIQSVVWGSREATQKEADARAETRLDADWQAERQRWIKQTVGGRYLGGSLPADSDTGDDSLSNYPNLTDEFSVMSPKATLTSTGAPTPYAAKRAGALMIPQATTPKTPMLRAPAPGSTLTDFSKEHVRIVVESYRNNSNSREVYYEQMERLVDDSSPYANAWRLLNSMSSSSNGALSYLARQFQQHILMRVRNAALSGRTTIQEGKHQGFARDIATFVQVEIGADKDNYAWPLVYYALRCGDAVSAKQILEGSSTGRGESDRAVLDILNQMSEFQGQHSCIFDAGYIQNAIRDDSRGLLSTMYHQEKNSGDKYKVAALALLSLAEPFTSSPVIQTIEDYLYGSLWYSYQQQDGGREITMLGEQLIKEWGPDHFDDDNSTGGWSYAFSLLVAQQFRTALRYLSSQGGIGLLQATHLALGLHWSEVDVQDFGAEEEHRSTEQNTTHFLLASYALAIAPVDPVAALQYLVFIPDDPPSNGIGKEATKAIRSLILRTGAFEAFAGSFDASGTRNGGALSAHFSDSEVSSILAEAGSDAALEGNLREAAELFLLGERYGELLSLLNRQLSSFLHASAENSKERKFWQQAASRFQDLHLSHDRSRAIQSLEAEGKLQLSITFKILMNLTVFFDRWDARDYEGAWIIIDGLELLPTSTLDLDCKAEAYPGLDATVRAPFAKILLASMEALYYQHSKLKSHLGISDIRVEAVDQRLKELCSRGRLLANFTGRIPLQDASDAKARIARLDAHMM